MAVSNTELLIQIVQTFPELYDTSHIDYKHYNKKKQTWEKVASIIGNSDAETLKKQWKNLRDAYSKHLKSRMMKTGPTAKLIERYRFWPWAHLMTFLRPFLEHCENIPEQKNAEQTSTSQSNKKSKRFNKTQSQSQSNDSDSQSEKNTPQKVRKRVNDHFNLQTQTAIAFETALSQHDSTEALQKIRKRRKRRLSQNQTKSEMRKVKKKTRRYKEQDDDIDFLFKSYAKKLKKMSRRRQATVKYKIAKVMLKAELEESHESESGANLDMISEESDTNASDSDASSEAAQYINIDPSSPPGITFIEIKKENLD